MEKTDNKLTYEQLETVARQLQTRVLQAEGRLAAINLTQMRLDYLFKVLDKEACFKPDFITECTLEISELLFPKEESEEEPCKCEK